MKLPSERDYQKAYDVLDKMFEAMELMWQALVPPHQRDNFFSIAPLWYPFDWNVLQGLEDQINNSTSVEQFHGLCRQYYLGYKELFLKVIPRLEVSL